MTPATTDAPMLDVRPAADFCRGHRAGAVNIPLEELDARAYELPPRDRPFIVFDVDRVRAELAANRLRTSERCVADTLSGESWLQAGPIEVGPGRARLWRAHALLLEAIDLARRTWGTVSNPAALDLACGSGRDAVQLALSGFQVHAWDVLPDALNKCGDLARRHGVHVETVARDLEATLDDPPQRFHLVCCFNFLHRPLMPWIRRAVRPGGFVVYETFVKPQQELFGKPARPQHVLEPGELKSCFEDFDILVCRERLAGPRRMAASLIARRPV